MTSENQQSKEITLDDLAIMIQRGFQEVHEKMATKVDLAAVETKLVDRIDALDLKLTAYITEHQRDYDRLDERITTAEKDIVGLYKLVPAKR